MAKVRLDLRKGPRFLTNRPLKKGQKFPQVFIVKINGLHDLKGAKALRKALGFKIKTLTVLTSNPKQGRERVTVIFASSEPNARSICKSINVQTKKMFAKDFFPIYPDGVGKPSNATQQENLSSVDLTEAPKKDSEPDENQE